MSKTVHALVIAIICAAIAVAAVKLDELAIYFLGMMGCGYFSAETVIQWRKAR